MGLKKRFKETEIGNFPLDWKIFKLSEVADVRDGTHDSPKYFDSGIPLVTQKNLKNGIVEFENIKYISKEDAISINKRSKVSINDILISMIGTLGEISVVDKIPNFCIKNVALLRDIKINNTYLKYFLKSKFYQDQLLKNQEGGIQQFISLGKLRSSKISIPTKKDELTKIISILVDIEKYINLFRKLLEKKINIHNIIKKKLILGTKRVNGFNKKWVYEKLSDILDYEQPGKYITKKNEFDVHGRTPILTANKAFILGYTNEKDNLYKLYPVIIFDDFTTDTKFVNFPFKVRSSALKILKPKKTNIDLYYIFNLMKFINFSMQDHKRYWISEYQKIICKIPDFEEQKKISSILQESQKEIQFMKIKLNKIINIQKNLNNNLLSGKL